MRKQFDILKHKTYLLVIAILVVGVACISLLIFYESRRAVVTHEVDNTQKQTEVKKEPVEPTLVANEVVSGLKNPWEIAFLPDGSFLVTERQGKISHVTNGATRQVSSITGVNAIGEGGLTGLAIDSEFAENRFIYTCFNARTASGFDVRLARWRYDAQSARLEERSDIVTGIPSNRTGRHSGCRVKIAPDGTLWVGTGDAAVATHPQNPQSLGGKILHITRDGMPARGNLPAPFDPRIFSYGHRNVQGIVLFQQERDGIFGYSVEHGSDADDEINLLKSGNYGWAPRVTYVERGVPMTDLERFPEAVSAVWSSGSPTIAPSGAALLNGEGWGVWNGAVAMAVLKDRHVRIMKFNDQHTLVAEKKILTEYGRVRTAVSGPDGALYITTDNGSDDKIVRIIASQPNQ